MALQISYSHKGIDYTDTYHRVSFTIRDKKKKQCVLLVKIYACSSVADTDPENYFDQETIHVLDSDFDTYFAGTSVESGQLYPEKVAYDFMATINCESGTSYPSCRFDYQNSSTSV